MADTRRAIFTRRDALKTALLTGVGAALGNRALAASSTSTPALITKAIPSTGEKLPVIGLGTNAFNESLAAELRNVISRFNALGATMIDTAASYGESEAVIGRLAAELGLRSKLFLATKFTAGGGMGGGPPGGSGAPGGGNQVYGRESFERSLARLKTDHLDLLYVHNMSGTEQLLPQMQEWKQAKKVRYLGISTSADRQHQQMVEEMRKFPLDFVQVNYSIAGRDAAQTVLPLALERKIAVVANVPLGGRGGRSLATVSSKPLPPFAAEIGVTSWAQFMLKYVMSHPAVTCVISGSTKVSHIDDNQQAGRGVLPDAAMRRRMEEYWDSVV